MTIGDRVRREVEKLRGDIERRVTRETVVGWLKEPAWGGLLLALWLLIGPFICGFSDVREAWTVHLAIMMMAGPLAIVGTAHPVPGVIFMGAGAFLVIAPWGMGYGVASVTAGVNDTIVGLLFAAVGMAILRRHSFGSVVSVAGSGESDRSDGPTD